MKEETNFYLESIIKEINGIKITVDFRTELLGIIMIIGNYKEKYPFLFNNYENKFYVDNIIKEFHQYKEDKVIKDFDELVENHSFNYDAPFTLFLQLDNNLKVDKLDNYIFNDRLNKDSKVYDFIAELNNFAKKINFKKYYQSNLELYEKMLNNISGAFKKYNITKFFKNYYGYLNEKELIINLTPFTTDGGYCCNLEDKIISCFPIYKEMKKEKLYDSTKKEKYIIQNPLHEFSHGYVNPITEEYKILTEKTNLFDDIRDTMKKMAYPYDTEIINEHIIRGIEARFIKLKHQDDAWYTKRIEQEKDLGFIYIDTIIDSLITYENSRDKYKTLKEFYPEIIKNIITKKEMKKPRNK